MRGQSLLSLFSRDGPQELRLEVKSTQNLNSSLILHFLLTFDLYFFFPTWFCKLDHRLTVGKWYGWPSQCSSSGLRPPETSCLSSALSLSCHAGNRINPTRSEGLPIWRFNPSSLAKLQTWMIETIKSSCLRGNKFGAICSWEWY